MPPDVPQAVAFDLDGLLFNTEVLHQQVGAKILERRGCQWSDELRDTIMGRQGQVALAMMIDWHKLDATVEELAAEAEELFPPLLERHLDLMPGARELLAALETAGTPKAVTTSSGRAFTVHVLSRFDLVRRFAFLLTAEDITRSKPDPEIYLAAARRFGVGPQRLLVLEDSHNGCRSATSAGAIAVAVPGEHSRGHDFAGVALVADSLADSRIYDLLGLEPVGGDAGSTV